MANWHSQSSWFAVACPNFVGHQAHDLIELPAAASKVSLHFAKIVEYDLRNSVYCTLYLYTILDNLSVEMQDPSE